MFLASVDDEREEMTQIDELNDLFQKIKKPLEEKCSKAYEDCILTGIGVISIEEDWFKREFGEEEKK